MLKGAVFTGHLDGADLARAVASADILLHPSRTEAFGNVVLEAMAAGLPVGLRDSDSARALVDDGRTGFLCSADDPDHFAGVVAELVMDAGRRREIGAAARNASGGFSWQAASDSVLTAYQSVHERLRART